MMLKNTSTSRDAPDETIWITWTGGIVFVFIILKSRMHEYHFKPKYLERRICANSVDQDLTPQNI